MALHLPIGPLKTYFELEPVPRCEPSTYQPISLSDIVTVPMGPIHVCSIAKWKNKSWNLFTFGNVLFNDTLNTFYLWLYGVGHMVKNHSDSEKGNLCCYMGYFFRLAKGFLYMHHPTDRIAHTTAFVAPIVEHWLVREIAQLGKKWWKNHWYVGWASTVTLGHSSVKMYKTTASVICLEWLEPSLLSHCTTREDT